MIKKTLITSILAVAILAFSVPASATSSYYSIGGQVYDIYGKITFKVDFKNYVTVSATLPKVENFGEFFAFFEDGTFMDYLLYSGGESDYASGISYPTWSQSGSNYVVDLTDLADSIESALGSFANISGSATKNPSISGKVLSGGNAITGKANLGWNISTYIEGYGDVNGVITVSLSCKGVISDYWHIQSRSEGKAALQKAIKDTLKQLFSSFPKKGAEPIK